MVIVMVRVRVRVSVYVSAASVQYGPPEKNPFAFGWYTISDKPYANSIFTVSDWSRFLYIPVFFLFEHAILALYLLPVFVGPLLMWTLRRALTLRR